MPQSLAQLLVERVQTSGTKTAVRYKENRGPYRDMTWNDFGRLVQEMSYGLISLGLECGGRAAVMAPTSYHWSAADMSIISAAGVSVPVYPTSSSSDIEHILNNSEAGFVFVYNENLLNKVLSLREKIPQVKKIVLLTTPAKGRSMSDLNVDRELVIGVEELLELGRTLQEKQPELLNERQAGIKREVLATIIYTSGTTGVPKGVMLTHDNILSVIDDLPGLLPIGEKDTYLSFLPLSHVFERICGEFYWIANGAVSAYAEGIEYVAKNMSEANPTIMLVVPRILDKIYGKVKAGIDGASPRSKKLIEWAIAVGKQVQTVKNQGRGLSGILKGKFWLAEKLVLAKLRDRISPTLRLIVSGGAPATAEVIEFFNAIGITVLEGYGLTETSAPTNVNRIGINKFGTVGPRLASVEMRIADDGEILFKGPTIFGGYYRQAEMTKEVFSEDGWFHTGDIGVVDHDGYLKITDRKKDIIVNSAGKNIAPQKIETLLKTIPLVSQVTVFGDKRKTLVALLTLDEQSSTEFAREKGWSFKDFAELIQSNDLRNHLQKQIDEKCKALADYESVRNFAILAHELSVESGELTATLKVKRNVVYANYKGLVESLYKEDSAVAAGKR
ncbi:MAG: long-chain fatty acid--CoA ligase [Candidatus Obscuribacterales bacterium]|nr:long-chain fatty acid--CoA ligase [Candidatus Obscuribacterales bacterium]